MPELIPPLLHLGTPRQEPVHRALQAEICALVEQGGVDLGGGQVHEAKLVQPREHRALLVGGQGARRGTPPRGHVPGPSPAVVSRARQPERRACGRNAQLRSNLGNRRDQEDSPVSGVPSNAATCFCSSNAPCALHLRIGLTDFAHEQSLGSGSACRIREPARQGVVRLTPCPPFGAIPGATGG
jgi:hypothetical protein